MIPQMTFLPSLSLSHWRSDDDDGLRGQVSSGEEELIEDTATEPSMITVAQMASRSEGWIGVDTFWLNNAAD